MGSGSSRRRGAATPDDRNPRHTVPAEPARPAPAAGRSPPPRDAGRGGGAAAGGGGGSPPEQPALPIISPAGPEDNGDHQCPERNNKKSVGQSTISYDYSEEELMASIEREYCR